MLSGFLSVSWLAALCINSVSALHASEVGVVDWHKSFIGVPLIGSPSISPTFHRVGSADGPTQSVVLAATSSNVLAALSPMNGSISWRYVFEDDEHVIAFKRHGDAVAAVSGPGGATLRIFDAVSGHLRLERRLHNADHGRIFNPETLGTSITFEPSTESGDVYILSNGHVLRRVNSSTGDLKWGWTSPDQASLVVYFKVVSTPTAVYLIGLAKSFASYTLHISVISPETGELLTSANLPSSISDGMNDVILLNDARDTSLGPRIVWLEGGAVRSIALSPELKGSASSTKGNIYKGILDIGLNEHGQIVAQKEDGTARVMKLEHDGLKVIWEFADSATVEHYSNSIYSGGFDKDGWPYVARTYWSHLLQKASVHVHASHLAEGKGLETGYTFAFDTKEHGIIRHVAVDVANPSELKVIPRVVLTTTTGAVQLWQQEQLLWTREEALANIVLTELVELPERKVVASHIDLENEAFGARLTRQLADAQNFPAYVSNFVKRFVTGSYASASSAVDSPADSSDTLYRDTFGFRKIIVAATPFGKIYGIDSANGRIVWSRVFGLGWAAKVGATVIPAKIFTLRTVGDGDKPQVALIAQRRADNSLVDTVLFHFDPLTGEDVTAASEGSELLQGHDVIPGEFTEAFLLPNETTKAVILFDEFLQVHIYPDTPATKEAFKAALPKLRVPLRTGKPGARQLTGHQITLEPEFTGRHLAYPTWTLPLPPSEEILALVPRTREPVASLGKVLGNRTTLYKYLNPHLVAVVAGSAPPAASCSVYLIDGAKGTIVYQVAVPPVEGTCNVKVMLTENWLVYHYWDAESAGTEGAKGYRVVSVELYEGAGVDDKTKSSDLTAYSNATTALTVFEKAYVSPSGVSTLTTTSTKYGITVKDIILATKNRQVQSLPRRLLDPRRPHHKPTTEESEEWLMQYDPVIPDDPRRTLSHSYEVEHVRRIVTSPSLLESTSLVFAFGLDLFFTRVAPSDTFDVLSENFNKLQLVLTVAGLGLAIVITKPMVSRKRLRERWYD
ncbi:hypothetical protein CERSUDRAFT_116509 [Gelatoporia subvermispora B]|uniref:ER membrane protein complex subunit 1 n=1 Tax=Ceriporiopsis subvermispora (strain B) TaxID=914234 RepID=M2QD74_CERS8|nr:hypothetical protein CERSUDRAFT_116509 [Gelatoporia subvermispora B]